MAPAIRCFRRCPSATTNHPTRRDERRPRAETPPSATASSWRGAEVAAVIGLVVVILIVLGVRGCLDARKTRSYENFIADLQSLVTQTGTLSKGFFQHLDNPGGSKLTFQTELKTDAGTAASLATRAQDLSTPGELSAAHSDLALAYSLRATRSMGSPGNWRAASPTRRTPTMSSPR